MKRRWIVGLASVIMAAPASAQFTTFIAPPSPVKDSIKAAVAAGQRSGADSITHAQIADMKLWVDSVAGLTPVRPAVGAVVQDTVPKIATAVSNGVIAPETASPLPLLLVLGGSAVLLGLTLMRRPAVEPRRIDS